MDGNGMGDEMMVLWWCGGFIDLFPLWVEWLELVERWNLPPFLSQLRSTWGVPHFCTFSLYGFLGLQVDLLSLSSVQTSLNCFLSSFGPCAALLVHCLH